MPRTILSPSSSDISREVSAGQSQVVVIFNLHLIKPGAMPVAISNHHYPAIATNTAPAIARAMPIIFLGVMRSFKISHARRMMKTVDI